MQIVPLIITIYGAFFGLGVVLGVMLPGPTKVGNTSFVMQGVLAYLSLIVFVGLMYMLPESISLQSILSLDFVYHEILIGAYGTFLFFASSGAVFMGGMVAGDAIEKKFIRPEAFE